MTSTRQPTPSSPGGRTPLAMGTRVGIFAGVCVLAAAVAVVGLLIARRDQDRAIRDAEPVDAIAASDGVSLLDSSPLLLFESTALGDTYGRIAWSTLDDPAGERTVADLRCERVHFRAGVGVCLQADRGVITTFEALVFDDTFDVLHRIGLAGTPSRVRVSPGGALAGVTVFVSGHSYADAGFSTQTTLIDLRSGTTIADLEVDFSVWRDGDRWREVDFNLWGVTFVDDASFYATLGTGGSTHLVRGDVATRELVVVRAGIECPSLSPDGTRIAFKAQEPGTNGVVRWRVSVLDLATGTVTPLAEDRNVDDQVAWVDDATISYGLPNPDSPAETNTWAVAADGSGQPELLVPRAWSAAVVP